MLEEDTALPLFAALPPLPFELDLGTVLPPWFAFSLPFELEDSLMVDDEEGLLPWFSEEVFI